MFADQTNKLIITTGLGLLNLVCDSACLDINLPLWRCIYLPNEIWHPAGSVTIIYCIFLLIGLIALPVQYIGRRRGGTIHLHYSNSPLDRARVRVKTLLPITETRIKPWPIFVVVSRRFVFTPFPCPWTESGDRSSGGNRSLDDHAPNGSFDPWASKTITAPLCTQAISYVKWRKIELLCVCVCMCVSSRNYAHTDCTINRYQVILYDLMRNKKDTKGQKQPPSTRTQGDGWMGLFAQMRCHKL